MENSTDFKIQVIPTGDYNLDIVYLIWNALREMALTGDQRDQILSKDPRSIIKVIELDPVAPEKKTPDQSPSLNIIQDSTSRGFQNEATFGSYLKEAIFRIQLFVHSQNKRLTEILAYLTSDLEHVLDPRNFIGVSLSKDAKLLDASLIGENWDERLSGSTESVKNFIFSTSIEYRLENPTNRDENTGTDHPFMIQSNEDHF